MIVPLKAFCVCSLGRKVALNPNAQYALKASELRTDVYIHVDIAITSTSRDSLIELAERSQVHSQATDSLYCIPTHILFRRTAACTFSSPALLCRCLSPSFAVTLCYSWLAHVLADKHTKNHTPLPCTRKRQQARALQPLLKPLSPSLSKGQGAIGGACASYYRKSNMTLKVVRRISV